VTDANRDLADVIDEFVAAFNQNDLDRVMSFFSETAEYSPGNGTTHHGRAAIRAEFAPQFTGRYGAMRFEVHDRLVDHVQRRVAIRWVCRIDISGPRGRAVPLPLRLFARLRYGTRMRWHGVDVLHFDADGAITGKYTYANYRIPPPMQRDLEPSWE
jgi:uncharacterized protein (TIGR02246 family)